MTTKEQAPGFIVKNISVGWEIKEDAYQCPHLDFDWCNRQEKKCCWDICKLRIQGSFKEGQEVVIRQAKGR